MKTISNTYSISIKAKPETVFDYVSDLTRHPEWNDRLMIEAVSSGPVGVGSQYHSWGWGRKQTDRPNDIRVTGFEPPARFAFVSFDPSLRREVSHEFAFKPEGDGTLVERTVTLNMSPGFEIVWNLIILPMVARPGMTRSHAALKARFESSQG